MMSVDEMRRESGLKGDYWFYKVDYVPVRQTGPSLSFSSPSLSFSLNLIWLFCLSRQVPNELTHDRAAPEQGRTQKRRDECAGDGWMDGWMDGRRRK